MWSFFVAEDLGLGLEMVILKDEVAKAIVAVKARRDKEMAADGNWTFKIMKYLSMKLLSSHKLTRRASLTSNSTICWSLVIIIAACLLWLSS